MTGATDNLKENRLGVTQSNQLKFDGQLLVNAQAVIATQFKRPDHFSKFWLQNDLSRLVNKKKIVPLITKDSTTTLEVPFEIKDWVIMYPDILQGVEKVLDLMADYAAGANGTFKRPSIFKIVPDWSPVPEPGESKQKLAKKAAKPWLEEVTKLGQDKKKLIGVVKISLRCSFFSL